MHLSLFPGDAPVDELHRIATAIERTVTGPVWHGSPLSELVRDVSAADAAAHPIHGAHSIWELVLHIAAWANIVEARLSPTPTPEPMDAEDWPPVPATTPMEWTRCCARLHMAHESLADAVRRADPVILNRTVHARQHDVRFMLLGIPEHGAYHGGQIALLTRSLTSRGTA
jgi:uncharacterized damage-inducible protein DinB